MSTSKITYLGDLRTELIHLKSHQSVITDAPTDNQGKGEAFSPTDLTATSLGACIITTIGIYCKKEGIDIDLVDTTLEVTKIMSTTPPRKINEIVVKIDFSNKVIPENYKKELVRVAHSCPVAISLHPDIKQVIDFIW